MHWVIQDNLYADDATDALVRVLEGRGIPFTAVSMSRSGSLSPEFVPTGPVMVCGSVGLARIAQERGWEPGSFRNAHHTYMAWRTHWGERLVNADASVGAFRHVQPVGDRVFIRPAERSKLFSGGVMDAAEVRAWRDALIRGERSPVPCSPEMDADAVVVCGPLVTIYKECRFFVVDGIIVAGTTYKQGDDWSASPYTDPKSLEYARASVRQWQPARAFVLDTGLTPVGPRILEVNCINSAGFYGADVEAIVLAIEAMPPWSSQETGRPRR